MTKRVLVVSDMCTVGQCSLAAALPILSACGAEACPLPVELLSSHSVGFEGYSRNSTVYAANEAVKSLFDANIRFDAVLSMYLGGVKEARVAFAAKSLLKSGGLTVVDPGMADFGELYPDLGENLIEEVSSLAAGADVVTPNVTEACLLCKTQPQKVYDEKFARDLAMSLLGQTGAKAAVITGASFEKGVVGAYACDGKRCAYFSHREEPRVCHGAGDLFSSALTGELLRGCDLFEATRRAEDFVFAAILATLDDPEHFYGLHFEKCLGLLTK